MATNADNQTDENKAGAVPLAAPDSSNSVLLIRQKLDQIYSEEPDVSEELAESEDVHRRSKHQKFMYELGSSGKDLAAIQTEWHNYYQSLPDNEKHEVWQEFYSSQPFIKPQPAQDLTSPHAISKHKEQAAAGGGRAARPKKKLQDARSPEEVKDAILDKVSAGGKLNAKHHLQSLLFGLGMGSLVLIIFLFSFFNEVIIAPFIQPSRAQADTPLIIGASGIAPTPNPEVIIPKINVEIPVDYSETSTNEAAIESDLEDGVVHYPTTSVPGQDGNAAFFGHSSNNIFNGGHYKFAFVLLHTLVDGDTFYLTYNDKVYVYKVISHIVVPPSDTSVLNPVIGQTATATLITCDPPGTSINRLVVVGQQISPSPTGNSAATSTTASSTTAQLPSDGPTLWDSFIKTILGKLVVLVVLIGLAGLTARKLRKIQQPY